MSNTETPPSWNTQPQLPAVGSDLVTCWGDNLAACSSALAAYFGRLTAYQLEASAEMSRLSSDPSRATEAYSVYISRLVQMQAEMQSAVEKIMGHAQLLYENFQRGVEPQLYAPVNSAMGAMLGAGRRYGQVGSENPSGPGDWRFDPERGLPFMASTSAPPTLTGPLPASTLASPYSPPLEPMMMPAMPLLNNMPPLSSATPAPIVVTNRDESSAGANAQDQLLLPASPIPPAPQIGYALPSSKRADTAGISYRCDGYRRVARAKS